MSLSKSDPQIANLIKQEEKRQREVLEMIPSENYASHAVMEALGTVLGNKYSEGYPKKRYYQGNKVVDEVESELRKSGTSEVSSKTIGELVAKKLKKLDKVAYIRFASVYREFADIADFENELSKLSKKFKR